jgi:tRNA nucleotidyltransferase (CCA-adding enzyme)
MRSKIKQVCEEILQEIKPDEKEKREVAQTVSTILNILDEEIKRSRIEACPELEGSVAHGTWVSGERDIDIFILFPLSYPLDELKRVGLELGKKASKGKWRERYAEHPFIEASIDGYRIDIVPCYKISKSSERVTSVDRTPLHTEYLSTRIGEGTKDEIILLKAFMKGIGVYGAELKINGFSGYLCELLTIHYGSFEKVLRSALRWATQEVIDIEKHYRDGETLETIFTEPLIFIDPIDPTRNVAAAVSSERIAILKGAAEAFLKDPSTKFFKPKKIEIVSANHLKALMKSRGTDTLFILIPAHKISPDIVWGELKKSLKAVTKLLELHDFKVLNSDIWSDEENEAVMVIELASANLPLVRSHQGPAAGDPSQQKFLDKHILGDKTLAGPWIREGKWFIELKRDFTNAKDLVETKLREGSPVAIGLSKDVGAWVKEGGMILKNEEIVPLYDSNSSFAEFLMNYFRKLPSWLL